MERIGCMETSLTLLHLLLIITAGDPGQLRGSGRAQGRRSACNLHESSIDAVAIQVEGRISCCMIVVMALQLLYDVVLAVVDMA